MLRAFAPPTLVVMALTALASLQPAAAQMPDAPPEISPSPTALRYGPAREAFEQGRRAEERSDWRRAFDLYARAVSLWPHQTEYWSAREAARFRVVQEHLDRAERAALSDHLGDARRELLTALALDPTFELARERLQQVEAMTAQATVPRAPSPEEGLVRLAPLPGKRNLDIRGNTRAAFEELARQFGLAVSFDLDLPVRIIRFRVSDVDFDTAISLLAQQTGTFWFALDSHLFHVVENIARKRAEFLPVAVRTIPLPGSATTDRMTETMRAVRELAGVARTQLDTRTRSLTLRDSPRTIALASALIEEIEQPAGELSLEVEVLEVDRATSRRLGITPPSTGRTVTLTPADIAEAQQSTEALLRVILRVFGTPASLRGVTADQIAALLGTGQVSVGQLLPPLIAFGGGRTVFLATLPGAAASFSQSFSMLRRGRRMMMRSQDGQPAFFFFGERFPVNLATLTPSLVTPFQTSDLGRASFQSPFPAFQYEDLGLKVTVIPRLHSRNEVTLQLKFELRSLGADTLNGIPVIHSSAVEQSVRLRENETSLLAGIMQSEANRALSGWPGLGPLPAVGHLAARRDVQQRETELLILVTPRLLRMPARADRTLYAGREPVGAGVQPPFLPTEPLEPQKAPEQPKPPEPGKPPEQPPKPPA